MGQYDITVEGKKFRITTDNPANIPGIVEDMVAKGVVSAPVQGPPDVADRDFENRVNERVGNLRKGDKERLWGKGSSALDAGPSAAARSLGGAQAFSAFDATLRSAGRGLGLIDDGSSWGRDYDIAREAERRYQRFQEFENPKSTFIGKVGGGAVLSNALGGARGLDPRLQGPARMGSGTPGNTLTRNIDTLGGDVTKFFQPSASPNALARIGSATLQGGAGGALGAGLAGDDMGEGALWGAGIGGGVTAASEVASGVINAGKSILKPYLKASERADELINQAMNRDKVTGDIVAKRMEQRAWARGGDKKSGGWVVDAAGENTLGLADTAMSVPNEERKATTAMLNLRQKGQGAEVNRAVGEALGVDPYGYVGEVKASTERARAIGDKYFNKGLDKVKDWSTAPALDALDKNFSRVRLRQGISDLDPPAVKTLAQAERLFADEAGRPIRLNGREAKERIQILQDMVDEAYNNGRGTLGGMLKDMREAAYDALGNPAMGGNSRVALGRRLYRSEKQTQEAFDDGFKWVMDTSRRSVIDPSKIPTTYAEKLAFKIGAARGYASIVEGTVDGASKANALLNSMAKRRALQDLFNVKEPDERKALLALGEKMVQFSRESRTRSAIQGNSLTARRMAGLDDASMDPEVTARLLGAAARGDGIGMLAGIARWGRNRWAGITPKVAAEILRKLRSDDPNVARNAKIMADKLAAQAAARARGHASSMGNLGRGVGTVTGSLEAD